MFTPDLISLHMSLSDDFKTNLSSTIISFYHFRVHLHDWSCPRYETGLETYESPCQLSSPTYCCYTQSKIVGSKFYALLHTNVLVVSARTQCANACARATPAIELSYHAIAVGNPFPSDFYKFPIPVKVCARFNYLTKSYYLAMSYLAASFGRRGFFFFAWCNPSTSSTDNLVFLEINCHVDVRSTCVTTYANFLSANNMEHQILSLMKSGGISSDICF